MFTILLIQYKFSHYKIREISIIFYLSNLEKFVNYN